MTTYLGKSCSFFLPRVPFVNCRQFMYLVISLLVLRAGYGIWLYQFLIIAYLFTCLEIPPYSIVKYNEAKGHINPQEYHSQDLELTQRIAYANDYIREVNDRRCVASPRFKLYLLKFRKQEGGKQRVSLNFKFYKVGIHPSYLLARCWMKRIVARMLADCLWFICAAWNLRDSDKSRKGYHLITLNNSELLFFTAVLVNHYFALLSTCLID